MNIITLSKKEFQLRKQSQIWYSYLQTPAGIVLVLGNHQGIFRASFVDERQEVPEYAFKEKVDVSSLVLIGTEFQIRVWKALLAIPHGTTTNYARIAQEIGNPTACRAVANAVGDNAIAYLIPCHRVVRKQGDICGYNWGVERKRQILKAENVRI